MHAVMAKLGILPPLADMFGPGGQKLLDEMAFEGAYAIRIASLRDLLELYGRELAMIERVVARRLRGHVGYRAVQAISGVGPVMASIFVAEIGDVSRFHSAGHLCSWAGLTPTHRESDTKVTRGHITKQGSNLVRWAAIEAVVCGHGGAPIAPTYARVAARRGMMIARVAAAQSFSVSSTTAFATERSVAWPRRRLERFGHSQGASSTIAVAPPASGEADYLSEPAWLWPKHTMCRTRRNGRQPNQGLPAQIRAMVRSAVSGHHQATRTA